VADVVEFHPANGDGGVPLPGFIGRWQPFPVEYKRGRRKAEKSYFVQLCAQALCLEEMRGIAVPAGAIYHGKSHHRQPVTFDATLREHTQRLARQLHELIAAGRTPPPQHGPKCKYCSLADVCVPKLPSSRSARAYVEHEIGAILAEDSP
jgi:CRISPR-associated exonuclease Cas4